MKKYTIGIYFNKTLTKILLIKKNRPDWQKGKYNFPGGHIEKFDKDCMESISREFKEECNLDITIKSDWKYIGIIENPKNYIVHILTTIYKDEHGEINSNTDEKVEWHPIDDLPINIISNLYWLIPFAQNIHQQENINYLKFGHFIYEY